MILNVKSSLSYIIYTYIIIMKCKSPRHVLKEKTGKLADGESSPQYTQDLVINPNNLNFMN